MYHYIIPNHLTISFSYMKRNKNSQCFKTKLFSSYLNKNNSSENNKLLYSNRVSCIKINNNSKCKIHS